MYKDFTEYLSHNCKLIPCENKIPLIKDWVNAEINDDVKTHDGNFGWVLNEGDLVLDVDRRNGGEESFVRLTRDFNLDLEASVITPGGIHYYCKKPLNIRIKKHLKEYPGIDFLTKGAFVIAAGSEIKDKQYEFADDLFGFYQQDLPDTLLDALKVDKASPDIGEFQHLIVSDISEEEILSILDKLDHNMPNDQWVKVGMALRRWDERRGLELWEQWSIGGHTYQEGETAKRWRSFTAHNTPVTIGTLKHLEKLSDFDSRKTAIAKVQTFISSAEERDLHFELKKRLRVLGELSPIELALIKKDVKARYKKLTGVSLKVKDLDSIIEYNDLEGLDFENTTPDWCKSWVYVNSHKQYANIKTLTLYNKEGFNLENGRHVPLGPRGGKAPAFNFVSENGFVETVTSVGYFPQINDRLVNIAGSTYLNFYDSRTVPDTAEEYTEEGLECIKKIKRHTLLVCNGVQNAKMLLEFLAHNVQFPGKKILWAPIIQSIQGIGKSFFKELLELTLGSRNVGVVNPVNAMSDYNGWATDVCVNVLEELRITGKNRHQVANAIKPLITDKTIQINEKFVKPYKTLNTANYICFTNYKDAIPLTKDDRRWWPICCEVEDISEIELIVGEPSEQYFPSLFDSLRKHQAEVRKWLLEYGISEEFLELKRAPDSDYKDLMVATEAADMDYRQELIDMIATGGKYYNKDVISSPDLFQDAMFEYDIPNIQGRTRNVILKSLGYFQLPNPIKLGGKARRVWAKRKYSAEEVRKILKIS